MNVVLMLLGIGIFSLGAVRQFGGAKKPVEVKPAEPVKPVDPVAVIPQDKPAPAA
jgi:hypothetical protein